MNQENFIGGIRFKSLTSDADNKTLSVNFCYLKAVSRNVVTANVGVKILNTLEKPLVTSSFIIGMEQFFGKLSTHINMRYALLLTELIQIH